MSRGRESRLVAWNKTFQLSDRWQLHRIASRRNSLDRRVYNRWPFAGNWQAALLWTRFKYKHFAFSYVYDIMTASSSPEHQAGHSHCTYATLPMPMACQDSTRSPPPHTQSAQLQSCRPSSRATFWQLWVGFKCNQQFSTLDRPSLGILWTGLRVFYPRIRFACIKIQPRAKYQSKFLASHIFCGFMVLPSTYFA